MVWAAFWGADRSPILECQFDETAKITNGVSAKSYVALLQQMLPTIWEPGMIFMQDNAPIHSAKLVKNWIDSESITLMEWPARSPDLNPIENCWAKLKETIYKEHPELLEMPRNPAQIQGALKKAIEEAWESIGVEYFHALIESMPRRVEMVIAAEGWYTRY